MTKEIVEKLAQLKIFSDVSPASLAKLAEIATEKHYPHGQLILIERELQKPALIILGGKVRVYHTSLEGREQTISIIEKGVVNIPATFAKDHSNPANVVALEDSHALIITQDTFNRVVSETPELALAFLADLSEKLRVFVSLTFDLSLRSVRSRLAKFLLMKSEEAASDTIRLVHKDIASQIGTVRVVISRTLKAFSQESLIKQERQNIIILDKAALKAEIDV